MALLQANPGGCDAGTFEGIELVALGGTAGGVGELNIERAGWAENSFYFQQCADEAGGYSLTVRNESGSDRVKLSISYTSSWGGCFGPSFDYETMTLKHNDNTWDFSGNDRIIVVGAGRAARGDEIDGEIGGSVKGSLDVNAGLPDSICGGVDLEVSAEAGVTGSVCADSRASITFRNLVTGSSNTVSGRAGGSSGVSASYSLNIPDNTPAGETDVLEVSASFDNASDPEPVTKSLSIGNTPDDLSINEVRLPDSGCPGDSVRGKAFIKNTGKCDSEVTVKVSDPGGNNILTEGPDTIRSGETSETRLSFDLPSGVSGTEDITYTVDLLVNGAVIDSKSAVVNVSAGQFTITGVGTPSEPCVGEDAEIQMQATNTGGCEGQARFVIGSDDVGLVKRFPSDTVRDGSTLENEYEFSVPQAAASEDGATYGVLLQRFDDGEFVDIESKSVTITAGQQQLSVNTLRVPSRACVGREFPINVNYSNEGKCEGRARVKLVSEDTGADLISEPESIRSGDSEEAEFADTIPRRLSNKDSVTYVAELQVPSSDGWSTLTSDTTQVNVGSSNLVVTNVESPNKACAGSEFDIGIGVRNDGSCIGNQRVELVDQQSGDSFASEPTELQQSTQSVSEFGITAPYMSGTDTTANYIATVQEERGGSFTDIKTVNIGVNVVTPDISFSSSDYGESACAGQGVAAEYKVSNTGVCDGEVRVLVSNSKTADTTTTERTTVRGGSTTDIRASIKIPEEASEDDEIELTSKIQSRVSGEWSTVETDVVTVDVNSSNLSINSTTYPRYAEPGSVSGEVVVENTGGCGTEAEITVGGETVSEQVGPGASITVDDDVELGVDTVNIGVEVTDVSLGELADATEVSISPHKYVSVNIGEGVVEVVGGFDSELNYSGLINGSGISGANDLEDNDRLAVGRSTGAIKGTATTNSEDSDTYTFNSAQLINMRTAKQVVWVVDGENKGKSSTFKYNTFIGESSTDIGELPAPDADINVQGNPIDNLGVLRSMVGFDANVLNGSMIRRFR